VDSLNHPSTTQLPAPRSANKPQIPLAYSRHVSTRHVRRVELVRAVLFDNKLNTVKMRGLDTSNVSCRNVTWRAKWNLGLSPLQFPKPKSLQLSQRRIRKQQIRIDSTLRV